MKTIHAVTAAVLIGSFGAGGALAQYRAPGSQLMVTVARAKSDSGKQTEYDTGYSSSRNYSRSMVLKVTVRNMGAAEVDAKVEGLFVAEAMSAGAADGIYCRTEESDKIPPRGSKDFLIESEPLKGHKYSGYYYNYKSGSKLKGYIIRVFSGGTLSYVDGSTPSLQKLGQDEKALKKMTPQDEEPRRFGGAGEIPRRVGGGDAPVQPVQPVQPVEPPKKGGGATSF